MIFLGLNSNSWNSFESAFDWLRDAGMQAIRGAFDCEVPFPQVLAVQETRVKLQHLEEQALGWADGHDLFASFGRAEAAGKGPLESSGGVCIGVQKHLPSKALALPESLDLFRHRCVVRHVNMGFPSGILVVSLYLVVKECPKGPSNWKLLKDLAVFLLSQDLADPGGLELLSFRVGRRRLARHLRRSDLPGRRPHVFHEAQGGGCGRGIQVGDGEE